VIAVFDIENLDRFLEPDGSLIIRVLNPNDTTVRFGRQAFVDLVDGRIVWGFPEGEGIEILYRTSTFEWNLAKALFVLWIKLCFLAALALATATFLNFPLAVMVTLTIFLAGIGSGFIHESLSNYASFGIAGDAGVFDQITGFFSNMWQAVTTGNWEQVWKGTVKVIGSGYMLLMPPLGEYSAAPLLTEGRNVPLELVGTVAWRIGVLWTGIVAVIGYLIFRRRELARQRRQFDPPRTKEHECEKAAKNGLIVRGQFFQEVSRAVGLPVSVYHMQAKSHDGKPVTWTQWVMQDGRRVYFVRGKKDPAGTVISWTKAGTPWPRQ